MIKSFLQKKLIKYLKKQNGSSLVLMAVSLPLLLGFLGISVDLGNLYYQHSMLQTIADNAAIAGAKKYSEYNNKNTSQAWADAEKLAKNMIYINYTRSLDSLTIHEPELGHDSDNNKMIHISLSQTTPLYFIHLLPGIDDKSFTLNIDSYAVIKYNSDKYKYFNNLLTYSKNFIIEEGHNTITTVDNKAITFDEVNAFGAALWEGVIAPTTQTAKDNTKYDVDDAKGRKCLVNKNTREKAANPSNPNDLYLIEPVYRKEQQINYYASNNYEMGYTFYNKEKLDTNLDIETFADDLETMINLNTVDTKAEFSSNDIDEAINNGYNNICYNGNKDSKLTITNNINSINDNKEPFYYVVTNSSTAQLVLDCNMQSNSRPIIVCFLAGKNSYGDKTLKLTQSNKIRNITKSHSYTTSNNNQRNSINFYGILYAPYSQVELDDNGMTFNGSVIASSINSLGTGDHIYKSIFIAKPIINLVIKDEDFSFTKDK